MVLRSTLKIDRCDSEPIPDSACDAAAYRGDAGERGGGSVVGVGCSLPGRLWRSAAIDPLARESLHKSLGRVQRREAVLRVEPVRILRGEYPAAQPWQARVIDNHADQPLADAPALETPGSTKTSASQANVA
jgi:hypothetical protein